MPLTAEMIPGSTEQLAQRVRNFEVRLFHGTLVARAAFPAGALLTILTAAATGRVDPAAIGVWTVILAWTLGTLPIAWRRMDWVIRPPWVVRVEITTFVLLAFLGVGSRPWHVLHAYVPLAFCAFFLTPRAGRLVVAALIASFWVSNAVAAVWPGAPIAPPMAPVTPTALALTGWALVTYVRRLVGDVEDIIAAQRRSGRSLVLARQRLAEQIERHRLGDLVGERLHELGADLTVPATVGGGGGDRAALDSVLAGIRAGIAALRKPVAETDTRTVAQLVDDAVSHTNALGGTLELRVQGHAGDVRPEQPAPVARVLVEAIGNARRHGGGTVTVTVTGTPGGTAVEVRNPAPAEPVRVPGHFGLDDMEDDARDGGVTLRRTHRHGEVAVAVGIPHAHPGHTVDPVDDITAALHGRRLAYEHGVLLVRIGFVLLTGVLLFIKADQHRTLLPALVATAALLLGWNVGLRLGWARIRLVLLRRPAMVWVDGGTMAALVALEGGMSTPWIPLSMGSILAVVHFRSWRDGLVLLGLFAAGLLVGYGLMTGLPVDDRGTLVQDMPFGWVLNVAEYGVVLAIAAGMGWVFARAQEAGIAYVHTVEREMAALRAAAQDQARAQTRRELHANLRQYVAAARLRLGAIRDAPGADAPALGQLDARLQALRGELRELMDDLGRPAAVHGRR